MPKVFEPKLAILPPEQRCLWPELRGIPANFVLYGGTAIALHLGHRQSVDFDFFSFSAIAPDSLLTTVPLLHGAEVLQSAPNTLTVLVERGGPVQLSFFGLPKLNQIEAPDIASDTGLKMASLLDLAGTKVAVVQQRAEAKDYVDLDALIAIGGIPLDMALAAARRIYGRSFNPLPTLKALCYFDDGNLRTLSGDVRRRLVAAVQRVDPAALPRLRAATKPDRGRLSE